MWRDSCFFSFAIPTKSPARVRGRNLGPWIPAFAGMTKGRREAEDSNATILRLQEVSQRVIERGLPERNSMRQNSMKAWAGAGRA
jgi:hypothetical protein